MLMQTLVVLALVLISLWLFRGHYHPIFALIISTGGFFYGLLSYLLGEPSRDWRSDELLPLGVVLCGLFAVVSALKLYNHDNSSKKQPG